MKLFRRRSEPAPRPPEDALAAARGRALIEESLEPVVVLDESGRVVAASRRARGAFPELEEGAQLPASARWREPVEVVYEAAGQRETLVYLSRPGDPAAFEELRAGFTAAVSHELRTPLARLLASLEAADLPGAEPLALIEQALAEVKQIRELIDDVLFLSELETGHEVVALAPTAAAPVLEEVVAGRNERAERAGVTLVVDAAPHVRVPVRPRMLRVVAENLTENAIRYAGEGATFTLAARYEDGHPVLVASDDGAGVPEEDLPRLFERFYRADRARTSRGTGLGLAIVKHVVAAADGAVEASHTPGGGLTVTCSFTAPRPV